MSRPGQSNESVRDGTRRMLEQRAALVERGERMIGWKLGFGAPAWLKKFGLSGPLVGFLPQSRARPSGATVSCEGWARPVAEPEIAVHLGADVDDPDRVEKSISRISAAIELADVDPPPDDIEEVLAGNIYHRALILGDAGLDWADADPSALVAHISHDGSEILEVADLEILTGEVVPVLAHTAGLLEGFGERLRAGDIVIMGSVIPPLPVQPGQTVVFRLGSLPEVTVTV